MKHYLVSHSHTIQMSLFWTLRFGVIPYWFFLRGEIGMEWTYFMHEAYINFGGHYWNSMVWIAFPRIDFLKPKRKDDGVGMWGLRESIWPLELWCQEWDQYSHERGLRPLPCPFHHVRTWQEVSFMSQKAVPYQTLGLLTHWLDSSTTCSFGNYYLSRASWRFVMLFVVHTKLSTSPLPAMKFELQISLAIVLVGPDQTISQGLYSWLAVQLQGMRFCWKFLT